MNQETGRIPHWLQEGRVSIYVLPKVRKGFTEGLKGLIKNHTGAYADPIELSREMTQCVAASLRSTGVGQEGDQEVANALQQAVLALNLAEQQSTREGAGEQLRELRKRVEEVWQSEAAE